MYMYRLRHSKNGRNNRTEKTTQDRRERKWGRGDARPAIPHPPLSPSFPGATVFPCQIGKYKTFTCEENSRLEFIYWTRNKWQKVACFFWILRWPIDDISDVPRFFRKKDEPLFFPTVISSGNVFPTVITSGNVFSTVITSRTVWNALRMYLNK